jgi:replicative DNA helicase
MRNKYTIAKALQHKSTESILLPTAVDMEDAVLGAMILEKECFSIVITILKKEMFFKEQNKKVFEAIERLNERKSPVDILLVTQELKAMGALELVGGAYYVSTLTNRIASSINVEFHARIVMQKFLERSIITQAHALIKDLSNAGVDVFKAMENFQVFLKDLVPETANKFTHSMKTLASKLDAEVDKIFKMKEGEGSVIGIPTGLKKLDAETGGWQNSDLIIVAARPGMGKTSLLVLFLLSAAEYFKKTGKKVLLFSLEMAAIQIFKRLVTNISSSKNYGIIGDHFRNVKMEDAQCVNYSNVISDLLKLGIIIVDKPSMSITEIANVTRWHVERSNVGMVFEDYLQLGEGEEKKNYQNKTIEVGEISKGLKSIAKENDIPVIALSQLSRQLENRPDKRPMLSDLRDSGSIEQDADMVIFIYRPEYYGIEIDENNFSTNGLAEIIIAKHRNGKLDTVKSSFKGETASFSDYNSYPIVSDMAHKKPLESNYDFLDRVNR